MTEKNSSLDLPPKREIKSFVLRQGRITKGQEKALEDHWVDYGCALEDGMLDPAETFNQAGSMVVEIGFGNGDALLHIAALQPEVNFIGIEVHRPGVGRLVAEAEKENLKNLKVYCDDAVEVFKKCIADQSLERVQIFFPDPWHKRKHHKRRLIQDSFVELLMKKLIPGGEIHVATDWQDYAKYVVKVLNRQSGLHNQAVEGDYCDRPEYRIDTKFERRGIRKGHGVWDVIYKKIDLTEV